MERLGGRTRRGAPVIPEVCKGKETHSMPWLLLSLPENDDEAIRVGGKDGIRDIVTSVLQCARTT